jgi:hypothetical protein
MGIFAKLRSAIQPPGALLYGVYSGLSDDPVEGDIRPVALGISGGLMTEGRSRGEPVVYLTDEQLPDAGARTDAQTGAVGVPAWATSATVFVQYEPSTDPGASGGLVSCHVYVGASNPGTLVELDIAAIGTATATATILPNIGGAATVALGCNEEEDPSHPGKVTIKIVFR